MAVSPAIRVGIIVFLAVLAFGAVYWFLTGYGIRAGAYRVTAVFDNAMGMIEGSEVRMAGVRIGVVEKLSLTRDQRATMTLLVNRRYKIPSGSRFVVRVGLLIGERSVEIIPNRGAKTYIAPGETVVGEVPPRIEDLLPEAQKLVRNLNEASENLNEVLADEELRGSIRRSAANVEQATARFSGAAGAIRSMAIRNREEVDAIVANIHGASASLREMAMDLEALAARREVHEDLPEAIQSARRSVESVERTVASLEGLVTAPEFQRDVREAVAGAREAAQEAKQVIGRVGRIFGGRPRVEVRVPSRETSLDVLFRPEDNRVRAELSTTVPLENDGFVEVGLFDIGAGNKVILQPGKAVGSRTDLRYGIYASRLGIGLDHAISSRSYARLDLFDPYEPKLNVRAGYAIADNWGVILGTDDLFGDNRFAMGVQLTK